MAVALTQVGRNTVFGDKRIRIYDLTFSGNYATGGEALTAATLGFTNVDIVLLEPVAKASDEATAVVIGYDYTASKVVAYEGSTAGTALSEKTNAEAWPTGAYARVLVIGH